MSVSISAQNALRPSTQFRQPDNCPVATCSAIALYEQELERHRATETRLRKSMFRERELVRQKDELIAQKDVLAKESEHRFLNGLQLINSLLSAQSRGTENPEAAAQLKMAANRVATLGRVHRHLHTLDTLESVAFKQYLEELCQDLSDVTTGEFGERSLQVKGDELSVPRVTAVPLAFIASELITIRSSTRRVRLQLACKRCRTAMRPSQSRTMARACRRRSIPPQPTAWA